MNNIYNFILFQIYSVFQNWKKVIDSLTLRFLMVFYLPYHTPSLITVTVEVARRARTYLEIAYT